MINHNVGMYDNIGISGEFEDFPKVKCKENDLMSKNPFSLLLLLCRPRFSKYENSSQELLFYGVPFRKKLINFLRTCFFVNMKYFFVQHQLFLFIWNTFSWNINLFLSTPDYFLCSMKLFTSTHNRFSCNNKIFVLGIV